MRIARSFFIAGLMAGWAPVSQAVLLYNGSNTANTTGTGVPGWDYVGHLDGFGGTGSAVYLGNGWIITAGHNGAEVNTTFTIPHDGSASSVYETDTSTIQQIQNNWGQPGATNTDMVLVRLKTTNIPLPTLAIATGSPTVGTLITVIGLTRPAGAAVYYDSAFNTTTAANSVYAGYQMAAPGGFTRRWGTNQTTLFPGGTATKTVAGNGGAQTTEFFADFSGTSAQNTFGDTATSSEAQLVDGDSGGAAFDTSGPTPVLAGINLDRFIFNNQPTDSALFGNVSGMADLSQYATQINTIVSTPEPTVALLGVAGMSILSMRVRKRKGAG